jgi:hypothetical protein
MPRVALRWVGDAHRQAEEALTGAQSGLDGYLKTVELVGLDNEPAAVQRLGELKQARDDAQSHLDQLGSEREKAISLAGDWDKLTLAGRQIAIRAAVESVTIAPGRGAERVTIKLVGSEAPSGDFVAVGQ